jgi:hypothetical protein
MPTEPSTQLVPGVKQPVRGGDLTLPTDAVVKKTWIYISTRSWCRALGTTLPYLHIFIAYYGKEFRGGYSTTQSVSALCNVEWGWIMKWKEIVAYLKYLIFVRRD